MATIAGSRGAGEYGLKRKEQGRMPVARDEQGTTEWRVGHAATRSTCSLCLRLAMSPTICSSAACPSSCLQHVHNSDRAVNNLNSI